MSLPPDGRTHVSFKFFAASPPQGEDRSEADQKDPGARARLAKPMAHNVLATADTSMASTAQTRSSGMKRKASIHDAATINSALADPKEVHPGPPPSLPSPVLPRDSKSSSSLATDAGATVISQAEAEAIVRLSPLDEPRPEGFRRHQLLRGATAHFAETISACIPFGKDPQAPSIDEKDALHILLGDHLGTGHFSCVAEQTSHKKTNTPFPSHWSGDKILLLAWQIANADAGAPSSSAKPAKASRQVTSRVEGVTIKVVVRSGRAPSIVGQPGKLDAHGLGRCLQVREACFGPLAATIHMDDRRVVGKAVLAMVEEFGEQGALAWGQRFTLGVEESLQMRIRSRVGPRQGVGAALDGGGRQGR